MKSVKKQIALVVLLVLALTVLAGCGGVEEEDKYVGSWEVSGGKVSGVSLPQEQIKEQLGTISLTIQKGGTVKKEGIGLDAEGVWKESKDGITISDKDGTYAVSFVKEDDKLKGSIKGIEILFQKVNN